MTLRAFIVVCTILWCQLATSCFINHGDGGGAGCNDGCPNVDYSQIRFENLDNSTIYFKMTPNPGGDVLAIATMNSGSIAGKSQLEINFVNDQFNHFYFYSDPTFTSEIGKLIIKDTQPLYSSFCTIGLRSTSDFTPPTGVVSVQSLRNNLVCVRKKETTNWNVQQISVQDALGTCGITNYASAPADQFLHLYFYHTDKTCGTIDESNSLSQIILRNNKTSKISVGPITLR